MLLSKKESEMTEDEVLKLDIMKTIAIAKGCDPKNSRTSLNFKDGSSFEKAARFLVVKFDIKRKNSGPGKDKEDNEKSEPKKDKKSTKKTIEINKGK